MTPSNKPHPEDHDLRKKSNQEWQKILNPEQYRVMREAGTEAPYSGEYCKTTSVGTYHCACCHLPLFRSDSKFESGCGWPSFFEPLAAANLNEIQDNSLGMRRIEITCSGCEAHLGHVFEDGPPPTGLRYCINSVSLQLE